MARKVYITSDMSVDEKLNAIAEDDPQAALLWPWLLTVFDDWGRAEANSRRLKAQVFPLNNMVTSDAIEAALTLYAQGGLILIYEVSGKRYMAIPQEKWFKYQTHIRGEKRSIDKSRIPAPPCEDEASCAQVTENARKCAQLHTVADNCIPSPSPSPSPSLSPSPSKEEEEEGVGETSEEDDASVTTVERQLLALLKSIKGYPFDYHHDLKSIRDLAVDYPNVDLRDQIKRWAVWLMDNEKGLRQKNINYRSRLRNWLSKAVEWGRVMPLAQVRAAQKEMAAAREDPVDDDIANFWLQKLEEKEARLGDKATASSV